MGTDRWMGTQGNLKGWKKIDEKKNEMKGEMGEEGILFIVVGKKNGPLGNGQEGHWNELAAILWHFLNLTLADGSLEI